MNNIKSPIVSFDEARENHRAFGREDKFIAHEHVGKHPFIRNILYNRQHGLCARCQRFMKSPTDGFVHHLSYEIFCQFLSPSNPEIKIPAIGNDKLYNIAPNCQVCYFIREYNEASERCLKNIVLLCSKECHNAVHGIEPDL